jgi:hypothetical protein
LRPLLLGESIAPFRLLQPALAVIPVTERAVMDARAAGEAGYRHLAAWMRDIEAKWSTHASKRSDGSLRMTLTQQIDHMRKLSMQLTSSGPKIVYTKAGTLLSAAVVEDSSVVIDHKAYWASIRSIEEGRYLCGVVNSRTVLERVIPMQPRGWRDPRDFDNLVWELPIPEFDRRKALHRDIAAAAAEAEKIAADVSLPEGDYRRKRRAIRDALTEAGLAARMDTLVVQLLNKE